MRSAIKAFAAAFAREAAYFHYDVAILMKCRGIRYFAKVIFMRANESPCLRTSVGLPITPLLFCRYFAADSTRLTT